MAVRHSSFAATPLIWKKSCSNKRENPAQRVVLVYSCASDQNISIKPTALQIRSTSTPKLKVFFPPSYIILNLLRRKVNINFHYNCLLISVFTVDRYLKTSQQG